MKYFKFAQISAETGISWMKAQPISGPSLPFSLLPGLSNIIQLAYDPAYYLGVTDDTAQASPDNFIFEITEAERAEELKKHVEHIRNQRLEKIYEEERNFRQAIFSKYDESASVAGVYKYDQAKQLVTDNTAAAPLVRQEATIRGMDPVALAQRIIDNHEGFRNKEAKIAGIRGLVFDRLSNFVFNVNDADGSMSEFFSQEKVGEETEEKVVDGVEQTITNNVMVGKYVLDIGTRFKFLA